MKRSSKYRTIKPIDARIESAAHKKFSLSDTVIKTVGRRHIREYKKNTDTLRVKGLTERKKNDEQEKERKKGENPFSCF